MLAVSAYSITAPQTELTADAQTRTAQFTVDVKNEQPTFDRVVVDIDAAGTGAGAAVPSWFSVDRHLRPMPPGGSEQFLVSVTVPAGVVPGSFQMRPVAYSSDHPPEDTKVEGPLMSLTLPPPPVPPTMPWWRRWWPWWLIGIGVVVLLAAAVTVVIVVLSHKNSPPPPPPPTSPSGPPDRALQFSGTKVVTIPGAVPLATTFTVQATIVAGPLPTTPPTGTFNSIVVDLQTGGRGWALLSQNGQWGLRVCPVDTVPCADALAPLDVGRKHVVTATYDGTTAVIYQDGVQVASAAITGTLTSPSSFLFGGLFGAFNGEINNVAVWNTALPASRVSSEIAHPPTGPEPGLVGLWLFDEPSGQQVLDSSGLGFNGVLGETVAVETDDPDRIMATN